MTNPLEVAARTVPPVKRLSDRTETPLVKSAADRYWTSLRKRVQAGASLRNVRPAPTTSKS